MLFAGVRMANADSLQLLSGRDASVVLPVAGNGESTAPWLSPDGRFILFSSSANNLVTNDNGYLGLDAFLHDRVTKATVLASANVNGTGANGYSVGEQASTNGRYVLIQSDASDLLPGDTNDVSDIFVRDLLLATNLLVSVAADGGWGNGASTEPVMTPDGRWVAFVSAATNLVAGDSNGIPDLFARDLVNGTTTWITAGATGANSIVSTPLITPNGRYVAFFSTARGLAAGVPATTRGEIYLADLVANTMIWVSTNAAVTTSNILRLSNPPSFHPALSDDGRYVAFKCGWTNGTVAPPPPPTQGRAAAFVFQYDSTTGMTTILTTNAFAPWPFNDDVFGPEMTPDGRFVVFVERETTVATNYTSVRLWDQLTGTNVSVSVDLGGLQSTNSTSHTPAVSADGRYVTFLSDAPSLVANTISNGHHIYRRDLQTATTALVDVDTSGIGSSDSFSAIPALSADGQVVVFHTGDGNLVAGDTNKVLDVFLWGAAPGTNELISTRDPAAVAISGNALSALSQLSVSANGALVAFASYASDLVTNDFNAEGDVFVQDLVTGSNVLASVGLDDNAALGGTSFGPLLSADGQFVVFASAATNLVTGDTNLATDIFRRDLRSGTTTCESVNSGRQLLGGGDSSFPAISTSGRYVTFLCRTNVSSGTLNVFWRDMQSNLTYVVNGNALLRPPTLSTDGQRVAYFDASARLYIWDAIGQTNLYTNTTASMMSAAIAPGGNKVLYQTLNQLFVRDLAFTTNQFLYPSTVQIKTASPWSGDGRYVAFVTGTNLVAGDSNGTNDVYLRDLQTGTLTLISLNRNGTASANGAADAPVFSADGRFIAYRSFATDAALGMGRPPSLVLFDRATGSNQLIVTGTTIGWSSWVTRHVLSTNGAMMAFQSWDEGVVSGDRNRLGDAFAGATDFVSLVDSDGDGIPDWWLNQYFGHANGQAGDESRASDDADDDGLTNLEEYLAGTNPWSAASVLALNVTPIAGNKVALSWPAFPGRNYQVLATDDLGNPNWQSVPGASVIGSQGSLLVSATNAQRYFQVVGGN
jgi:Tol biopolymer transport system component